MSKQIPRKNRQEAKERAAKQHKVVCSFLDRARIKKMLPRESKTAPPEVVLLHKLLLVNEPVTFKQVAMSNIGSESTVTYAVKRLNKRLKQLSNQLDGLREKNIVITIPSRRGGLQIGRYFALQNTTTGDYLNASEILDILKDTWDKFKKAKARKNWLQVTERHLKQKLKSQASSHLSEKLRKRDLDDYQPLVMEVGLLQIQKDKTKAESSAGPAQRHPADHSRSWDDFNPDELLDPQGMYILSSDTGTGKTTFLRYLQLKTLEKNQFLPILLHASQLEGLEFEDINSFIAHLVNILKVKPSKKRVATYLKNLFNNKRIILLIDGLDQIEGAGTDYRDLLDMLLSVFSENLIVASRPFAVTSQEQNSNVKFLRLRPFSEEAQEKYFGNYYNRACELCVSCRELMAIPMLAYMVRALIEKKKDKDVKNRADLYKRFMDYILMEYRHDKIRSSEDIETGVRQAFAQISYEALTSKGSHIQKIPLAFCHNCATNHNLTLGNLLKHGLAKLIVDKSQGIDKFLYFSHQSFQEYLAAEWAHKNEELTKHILDEMWNPKWKEVIKFLTGKLEESFVERIYCTGFEDNIIHSKLFLAATCCADDLTPNYVPTLIRELSTFFILQSVRRSVAEPDGLQLAAKAAGVI